MKLNKKYIIFILFILIIISIVPICVDYLIIGNGFPSNVDNSDWVAFLGSYIGALIGAFTTLVGLVITINFTRKQTNEDRRLALAPYLKYDMYKQVALDKKHDISILHVIDNNENVYVNCSVAIKNVGMGVLIDFKIYNITYDDKSLGYTIQGDCLEKNAEWLMLIDIRLRLDEIKDETLIKNPPDCLNEYSPPTNCRKGGILFFTVGYRDIIGNKYEQDIKIEMAIGYISKTGKLGWEYTKPELRIFSIGKSRIVS